MVEVARQQGRQPRGELEDRRMAHLEGRGIVHAGGLVAHRVDDLLPPMAGIDAPQPGGAVEDAAALDRGVVHVLGADQKARLVLELPVRGERHPEGFEIVGRGVELRQRGRVLHRRTLRLG